MSKRRPGWVDPNPDPRNNANYDNGVWRNSGGKVIGRSQREDSEFRPASTNPNAKSTTGSLRQHNTPAWVRIHNERPNSPDVRVSHSLPQTRLRKNAITKLKANNARLPSR